MNKFYKKVAWGTLLLLCSFALPPTGRAADFSGLETTLSNYYKKLLVPLGILLAAIMIVIGGIMYATSQGDPQKTGRAKELIVGALVGLAILLTAGYIVKAIVS